MRNSEATQLKEQETHTLDTATGLSQDAVAKISDCLRQVLADVFALYLKTKKFHWNISGSHFRDYHLLLDEHASQIFAMTDEIAGAPVRSAGQRSTPSATSPGTSV